MPGAATRGVVVAQINASIPLGCMAEPREVDAAAVWLLSDLAWMVTARSCPSTGRRGFRTRTVPQEGHRFITASDEAPVGVLALMR
jgi:hypothetical protein